MGQFAWMAWFGWMALSVAQAQPAEETTDEPATEEPATGESGTEEPATEESGTEEPATEPAPTEKTDRPMVLPTLSDLPPPPPEEDDLPIPTLKIDRVPPNTSFEFGVQMSFGPVAYFSDEVPPWVGFGFRGGWGKNFGPQRIGVSGAVIGEGDIGVHTLISVEPLATWDYISQKQIQLGLSAGPSLVYLSAADTVDGDKSFQLAPTAAARLGWSQTWSRIGRRLFVLLEPKVRYAGGDLVPVAAIIVGSGSGR